MNLENPILNRFYDQQLKKEHKEKQRKENNQKENNPNVNAKPEVSSTLKKQPSPTKKIMKRFPRPFGSSEKPEKSIRSDDLNSELEKENAKKSRQRRNAPAHNFITEGPPGFLSSARFLRDRRATRGPGMLATAAEDHRCKFEIHQWFINFNFMFPCSSTIFLPHLSSLVELCITVL